MVERGAVLVRRRRVGAERVRHERLDAASRRRVQAREDRLALPRELQQAREGGGVGVVARAELGLEVVRQRVDGVGVLGGRAQVLREPRLVGRGPLGLADARGVGGRAGRRRGARRAAQREADRARVLVRRAGLARTRLDRGRVAVPQRGAAGGRLVERRRGPAEGQNGQPGADAGRRGRERRRRPGAERVRRAPREVRRLARRATDALRAWTCLLYTSPSPRDRG